MINSILFEGQLVEIKYRTKKMIKFVLEDKFKRHRATICCYKDEYFKLIEKSIGKVLIVTGEFWEISYQDSNGKWINDYTIKAKNIKKALNECVVKKIYMNTIT